MIFEPSLDSVLLLFVRPGELYNGRTVPGEFKKHLQKMGKTKIGKGNPRRIKFPKFVFRQSAQNGAKLGHLPVNLGSDKIWDSLVVTRVG